jgi:hypothetical protein
MTRDSKRGRRFFLLAALVFVLGALGGTTVLAKDGIPAIPHTLEGRSACLTCHGPGKLKPVPADHEGRTEAVCTGCHHAAP